MSISQIPGKLALFYAYPSFAWSLRRAKAIVALRYFGRVYPQKRSGRYGLSRYDVARRQWMQALSKRITLVKVSLQRTTVYLQRVCDRVVDLQFANHVSYATVFNQDAGQILPPLKVNGPLWVNIPRLSSSASRIMTRFLLGEFVFMLRIMGPYIVISEISWAIYGLIILLEQLFF